MTDTTSGTPAGGRGAKSSSPADPIAALEDLVLCSRRIGTVLDDLLDKNNISFEEWSIVKGLIGRDDVPIGEVARNAGVNRQQFRKLLGTLQQKGLVRSKTAAVGDKKQSTLSATPRAAALRPIISSELHQLLGGEKGGQIFVRAAARLARVERSLRKKSKAATKRAGSAERDDD